MIDGICIAECPVSPELLKSSHIVQHSKKPCQVNLCLLHPLRLRDPLAQFRHPISVVYFQFYFLIGRIISIRIFPECFSDPFTLDFHLPVSPSDFLILFPCPVENLCHPLSAIRLFRGLLLVHDGICLAHIVVQIAPGRHIRVDTSRTDRQWKRQFHLRRTFPYLLPDLSDDLPNLYIRGPPLRTATDPSGIYFKIADAIVLIAQSP